MSSGEVGVSNWKVWVVLSKLNLHSISILFKLWMKLTLVQESEYPRYLLNSVMEQYCFFNKILWTNETLFTKEGVFNSHNVYHWSEENPLATRERESKQRIWAGLVGDQLANIYLTRHSLEVLWFLQHTLAILLDGHDQNKSANLILQQNGAPQHCFNKMKD